MAADIDKDHDLKTREQFEKQCRQKRSEARSHARHASTVLTAPMSGTAVSSDSGGSST